MDESETAGVMSADAKHGQEKIRTREQGQKLK